MKIWTSPFISDEIFFGSSKISGKNVGENIFAKKFRLRFNTKIKLPSLRIHLHCFRLFFLLMISTVIISCNESDSNSAEEKVVTDSTSAAPPDKSEFTYSVFMNDSSDKLKGFGYDILMNGTPQIHQTNIPAVSGNQYFKTEKDATATAVYALYKLQKYMQLPVLTIHELDSLGVLPAQPQ